MKQKLKTYLQLSLFVFGIFFILTNCERELAEDIETQETSRFSVRTLNKNEVNSKDKIVSKLNTLNSKKKDGFRTNNQAREIYNTEHGFTINTDYVKYIEDSENGNHSYSFTIQRDNSITDKLENLLLHSNLDGGYDAYIVEYGFTKEEYEHLSENPENNYTTILSPIDFDITLFNAGELGKMIYGCTETWEFMTYLGHENGELHGVNTYGTCSVGCNYGTSEWVITGISCSYFDDGASGGDGTTIPGTGPTNPSSSSGPSNGGSGINYNPIISVPVVPQPWEEIVNCLNQISEDGNPNTFTTEMSAWLQSQPKNVIAQINAFIKEGNCSEETQDPVLAIINLMMADSNLSFEDAIIIYVFGEQVDVIVDGPDIAIESMSDYLSCFDTSQSAPDAKITIYVDEPVDGSNALVGADGTGHTFVSIEQGNNIATFGFYPVNGLPSLYFSVDGVMGDNSNTTYDVSITIDNVPTTEFTNGNFTTPLQSIINHTIAFSNSNYDINGQNCTDLGIDIANLAGLPMPACNANPIYFFGSTPGRAGEYIRNLTILPEGVSRDIDGGISSDNNCN